MNNTDTRNQLIETTGNSLHTFDDPDAARLIVHENNVLDENLVDGLHMDTEETDDGISVSLKLDDNVIIEKPVHLCFGVIPESGIQKIQMKAEIGKNAKITLLSHCSFPFARDVQHIMDGDITVGDGAEYTYLETHVHSDHGGIHVVPHARVRVGKNAVFRTDFTLKKGRVGSMDIQYETFVQENGLVDMTTKVSGSGDDTVRISENATLEKPGARAVLTSKVAVRDNAAADVYNKVTATAPHTRGHVDCKEIIRDNGRAQAVPIVDVQNPLARVTHEAAVGSVDKKQLQTLMARGLDEDQASEMIIQGLLS